MVQSDIRHAHAENFISIILIILVVCVKFCILMLTRYDATGFQ